MSIPVVDIQNLDLSFRGKRGRRRAVLHNVSLRVEAGEIVGVVGESGSGKSVTASTLPMLLPDGPDQIDGGCIRLMGRNVAKIPVREFRNLRGKVVSVIFQEPMTALNPSKTIGKLIGEAIGAHAGKLSGPDMNDRIISLLHDVQLPDPERVRNQYAFQLSGGMRQRVMIAIAFAHAPRLLIADEPTTALDVTLQKEILYLIERLARSSGTAVLFICHDLGVVAELCDRLYVMREGRVVESGPAMDVLTEPKTAYTRSLIESLPDRHPPRTFIPIGGVPDTQLRDRAIGDPVLSCLNLNVQFVTSRNLLGQPTHWVNAVQDVELSVRQGTTHSVIGESGSGKTTLARTFTGLQAATSGSLDVLGQSPLDASRTGRLQIVFQDPRSSLNLRLPVWRLVSEPLSIRGDKRELRNRAAELLELSGLSRDDVDRSAHEFSGGERQRIAIARALSTDPEILILDEPTSALDATVQAKILNLLLDLQIRRGLTYLLITHDISVVAHMSDTISVMRRGVIVETGSADQIMFDPQHDYTLKLLASRPKGLSPAINH